MAQHFLDDLDLVELSDLAWDFLAADGSHGARPPRRRLPARPARPESPA